MVPDHALDEPQVLAIPPDQLPAVAEALAYIGQRVSARDCFRGRAMTDPARRERPALDVLALLPEWWAVGPTSYDPGTGRWTWTAPERQTGAASAIRTARALLDAVVARMRAGDGPSPWERRCTLGSRLSARQAPAERWMTSRRSATWSTPCGLVIDFGAGLPHHWPTPGAGALGGLRRESHETSRDPRCDCRDAEHRTGG